MSKVKEYSVKEALEIRNELEKTSYGKLKLKFEELGVGDVWKAGKKKEELIKLALTAIEKLRTTIIVEGELVNTELQKSIDEEEVEKSISEKLISEAADAQEKIENTTSEVADTQDEDESLNDGEYEVDQDLLDELPQLSAEGFDIGDIVVVEGKSFSKKPKATPIEDKILNHTFTREQVENNIGLTESNIRHSTPVQKAILFAKLEELNLMIKVLDSRK